MSVDPAFARRLWRRLEPIHAVTYFSPEPIEALAAVGYRGFWMGYFAGRAAPLGAVGPAVVGAAFYNFASTHVRRAIPDAWELAPPSAALAARAEGSRTALDRMITTARIEPGTVARAATLAERAARAAPVDGRVLFAANADLTWPEVDPVSVLWHAATLLREHRGDGHVAALTAAGLSGREAHVLHAASGATPREVIAAARHFHEDEWSEVASRLRARDLTDDDGALSMDGRKLKTQIEDMTDRLAATAFEALTEEEVDELDAVLAPIARAVVAAGEIPAQTPMGLDLTED